MNMNPLEIVKNLHNIQAKTEEMKKLVSSIRCTGSAMGNMVEVVATGDMKIESVKIDPAALSEGQKQMLEVLVACAVNNALDNVRECISQEAAKLTGQQNLQLF